MRELVARELITKANQAILKAHWLRREGPSLRFEASIRASELGETILRAYVKSDRSHEREA